MTNTGRPFSGTADARIESLSFQGVSIEVLVSATETEGAWSLMTYSAPAGFQGPPEHRHEEVRETFYVVAGRVRFRIDGEIRELGPGGVAVVTPGTPHAFSVPYGEPARMVIHCTPGGMEAYFREVAALVAASPTWPPLDPLAIASLGERHDIVPVPRGAAGR